MDLPSLWASLGLAHLGVFGIAWLMCFIFTIIPGPISGLIVQNTLRYGFRGGVFLCIGCALGETFAAFIGCLPFLFGITAVSDWLLQHANAASIGFGILIVLLGALNFRPIKVEQQNYRAKPLHALYSALYTGLHPANILALATLITLMQTGQSLQTHADVPKLLIGVCLGSAAAWSLYLIACIKARKHVTPRLLQNIRYGVAFLLMLMGLAVTLRGLWAIL